jgi:hypothetical protein
MKQLLLLPVLLFFFSKTNAQNGRWMYLSTSIDSTTQMVDTLRNDIKQLATYDGHSNVVLIWVKTTNAKSAKKEFDWSITHVAIDTANNQMEIKSGTAYKNGNIIGSVNNDYPKWTDVVPESIGEQYIFYCRALHDKKLMMNLFMDSIVHDIKKENSN